MSKHEHSKEMCALAALGVVPSAEAPDFNRHLASCDDCKQTYSDYVSLNARLVRVAGEQTDIVIESHRESARAAVFQSIRTLDREPIADAAANTSFCFPKFSYGRISLAWIGSLTATVVVCTFWLGTLYERGTTAATIPSSPKQVVGTAPVPVQNQVTQEASLQLELQNEQLSEALKFETQQSGSLRQSLALKDIQFSHTQEENSALQQQIEAQAKQLSDTQSALASKTAELSQFESAKSSDTAAVVALRYQVQDLTEKLNSQSESLKREKDLLSSGREIRDIIGARNLHIVDVYDTDTEGRTKRPFARTFYTEGKSLVFYAYDLPVHKTENGKHAYIAWGQSNGNKSSVRNLGILINDDQSQKRWMLSFSDPNVLAQIDSVFITLESAENGLVKPSGKRMLTAYLNDQVNHP